MNIRLLKISTAFFVLLGLMLPAITIFRSMQTRKHIAEEIHSDHWSQRSALFSRDTVNTHSIVFLGNSLTELFDLSVFGKTEIINHGISGDFTSGVLQRLNQSISGKPAKIFLEIGINDLVERVPQETMLRNTEEILFRIREASPATKLYVISLTPTDLPGSIMRSVQTVNEETKQYNESLYRLCLEMQVPFIDLYTPLQENGRLKKSYSLDGIHFTAEGYVVWKNILEPYVNE